jgi:MYXO-CTERM domain-containing protein
LHLDGDTRLWGCGQQHDGVHFFYTSDGVTWTPELRFVDVADHQCPAGTPGASLCAYTFASDAGSFIIADSGTRQDDETVGVPQKPALCACASSSSSLPWSAVWLLAVGGLVVRRRRR